MLENLYTLFDKCEEIRYQANLASAAKEGTFDFSEKNKNKYKVAHDNFLNKVSQHKYGETTPTGENIDAIKLYDIEVEEASIIYMYTSHKIFNDVNYQLRNHTRKLDDDIYEYKNLLNASLDKLPAANNITVFRDVKFPEGGIDACMKNFVDKVGLEIICKDFMSTHKSEGRWSDEETGFQMVIKTCAKSRGKDLANLAFAVSEEEVLFKSGTKFIVNKVDVENTTIYLTEIIL